MFDGVGWAAGEIVVFMVIASLIGLGIGWIVGRWLQRDTIAGDFENEIRAEKERADRAESTIAAGRADLEKAQSKLEEDRERFAELQATVDDTRVKAEDFEAKLSEASVRDKEIERLSGELEAEKKAAAERDAEVERLTVEAETRADLVARLEESARARRGAEEKVEKLEADIEDARIAAERTAGETAAAQADLTAELAAARDRAADADRLDAELAAGALERDKLTSELQDLREELETTQARHAAAPAVAAAEREVAAEEKGAVEEQPAEVERPRRPQPKSSAELPSKQDALARMSEIATRTAGDGPVADDDLKLVHGIGPKLERTLKDLGITSYRQIAGFQAEDIALVTAALGGFKGRIERDDWMSSAAEQHHLKYGESM